MAGLVDGDDGGEAGRHYMSESSGGKGVSHSTCVVFDGVVMEGRTMPRGIRGQGETYAPVMCILEGRAVSDSRGCQERPSNDRPEQGCVGVFLRSAAERV